MSRLDSRDFNPAQVYAQFTTSGKNESAVADKSECKHERVHQNNRREIQITETAEASLPPDKARVSVVCSNSKVSDYYCPAQRSQLKEQRYRISQCITFPYITLKVGLLNQELGHLFLECISCFHYHFKT